MQQQMYLSILVVQGRDVEFGALLDVDGGVSFGGLDYVVGGCFADAGAVGPEF